MERIDAVSRAPLGGFARVEFSAPTNSILIICNHSDHDRTDEPGFP
jgi:hypothetical protein